MPSASPSPSRPAPTPLGGSQVWGQGEGFHSQVTFHVPPGLSTRPSWLSASVEGKSVNNQLRILAWRGRDGKGSAARSATGWMAVSSACALSPTAKVAGPPHSSREGP